MNPASRNCKTKLSEKYNIFTKILVGYNCLPYLLFNEVPPVSHICPLSCANNVFLSTKSQAPGGLLWKVTRKFTHIHCHQNMKKKHNGMKPYIKEHTRNLLFCTLVRSSVRPKPLFWFRSDTKSKIQIGWYFPLIP